MTGGIAVLLLAVGLILIIAGARGTYEDVLLTFAIAEAKVKGSGVEPAAAATGGSAHGVK